jgi:hypothetical protein
MLLYAGLIDLGQPNDTVGWGYDIIANPKGYR